MSTCNKPKRILALSGGGVRGIVEVAFLEAVEEAIQKKHGPEARLCDFFDLIGGTSTGSLIATALALGISLADIRDFYLIRAAAVFRNRRWFSRLGQVSNFDGDQLEREFIATIGDVKLGDPAFQTLFAIITKRLDTGQPWILSNIKSAPYFDDPADRSYTGNRHYQVSKLLRAATAAPTYFSQAVIDIGHNEIGTFVDGAMSPHNEPSFALLQLSQLQAFGLTWETGADRLFILSLGTGAFSGGIDSRTASRIGPLPLAYYSLRGMIRDGEQNVIATMQWLGTSPRPVHLSSEIGSLEHDTLTSEPAFTYLRLDLPLCRATLIESGIDVSGKKLKMFQRMDDPRIIEPIYHLSKDYIRSTLEIDTLLHAAYGSD